MIGLLPFLREHEEAVRYDLLRCGLTLDDLGTDRLSWKDLLVLVKQAQPGSALHRAQVEYPERTVSLELLRNILHGVQVLAWQNTRRNAAEYPVRQRFPWDEPLGERPDEMEWEEGLAWLGWNDPTK